MSCPGYASLTPAFSIWVNENPYASGNSRKTRRSHKTSAINAVLAQLDDETDVRSGASLSAESNDDQYVRIAARKATWKIPAELWIPAETQAIWFFDYRYLVSSSPSRGGAMWTHLNHYRQQWENDHPHTMLGLAVSSLMLALFNHIHPDSGLAVMGFRCYTVAIRKISQALQDTKQVTSDQLLLAVMVASYYEVSRFLTFARRNAIRHVYPGSADMNS